MFAILHYAYCNILHSCILQCFATFHIANIAKTRGACIDVMCQLHTHRWGQSYILLQGLSYLLLEVQDFYALHCSPAFPESLLRQWLHQQNYYFTILFALFFICFLGFLPEHKCQRFADMLYHICSWQIEASLALIIFRHSSSDVGSEDCWYGEFLLYRPRAKLCFLC